MPDHAGAQYKILARTVERKTSFSESAAIPLLHRTRNAYSRLADADSRWSTWSAAVSLVLTMIPSTRRLCTRSMVGHGGGIDACFRRLPLAKNTISLDLALFRRRLFVVAHVSMCLTSAVQVLQLTAGITKYVSSAMTVMTTTSTTFFCQLCQTHNLRQRRHHRR